MEKIIDSFSGEYRFLSNYWLCSVVFEGMQYPSSEHAYQAAKSVDPEIREIIRNLPKPGMAEKMGAAICIRPDWESIKLSVMEAIVTDKFARNEATRKMLLNTGDAELIEGNHWHDNIWGKCECAHCDEIVGQNHLGKILMHAREELRSANQE